MATASTSPNGTPPNITLWTNHDSFWCNRLEIAMRELNLAYKEVLIDLSKPREDWFLKINPKGQVPTLRYSNGIIDETLTESAIIAQFLADAHPSHLLPASHSSPTAPLFRARVGFFVDTFCTTVVPIVFALLRGGTEEERAQKTGELVGAVEKEVEPLLKDAAPFLAGSKEITLAEV
ncbi:MAG: hypothetical protein FRX48_05441 [Lasallia pustulata]|uniref:GST N-terminal domain-containing protein n=1 Tax=Lasallia pustulata TaxID=136370 RepID=A0A5M8PNR1_9LECA|nr:MAG: hypothetical protein FRX48_05441 [Lasallia pustulata]